MRGNDGDQSKCAGDEEKWPLMPMHVGSPEKGENIGVRLSQMPRCCGIFLQFLSGGVAMLRLAVTGSIGCGGGHGIGWSYGERSTLE